MATDGWHVMNAQHARSDAQGSWSEVVRHTHSFDAPIAGRAEAARARLHAVRAEEPPDVDGLVSASPALHSVLSRARKVAPTDSTVLVTGETGTGKEMLARTIHRWSRRADRPFVSVNCAAIPHTLIASELFGHERGAFTGALQRRPGRFELAAGGTLFLDEVGELPAETQVALLRVLQEREFERVGGTSPVRADVRVVAATNRDLAEAIAVGAFRTDLYYRLNVFPLELPPLRERGGDVRLLVEHFIARYTRRMGKSIRAIDPRALEMFDEHSWPGNVRELQNVIERSLVVCESDVFSVDPSWLEGQARSGLVTAPAREPMRASFASEALPGRVPTGARQAMPRRALTATLDDIQREAILQALEATNWILGGPAGAAALLGLKRTTLQGRMQKLGILPVRPARKRFLPAAAT